MAALARGGELVRKPLNSEQQTIFDSVLESVRNQSADGPPVTHIVHGHGGTGKSNLIRHILAFFEKYGACTADMYLRATIGQAPSKLIGSPNVAKQIANPKFIQLVIVDEYSMLAGKKLTALDQRLRLYNQKSRPFGGVPLLLVGDPLQLPTVSGDGVFSTKSFKSLEPTWHKLVEQQRFDPGVDGEYLDLLSEIRTKLLTRTPLSVSACAHLDYRLSTDGGCRTVPKNALVLCPTNSGTRKHNWAGVLKLSRENPSAKRFIFTTSPATVSDNPADLCIKEDAIPLAEGSPIIVIRNVYSDDKSSRNSLVACNGERGLFVRLGDNCVVTGTVEVSGVEFEVVVIDKKTSIVVSTETAARLELVAKQEILTQQNKKKKYELPVMPAYSVTIHKMQGQTINQKIHIDATSEAAHEMIRSQPQLLYVALSRPTASQAVTIAGITSHSISNLVKSMGPQSESDRAMLALEDKM